MGSETDILYSDETSLYIVGTSAQNQICTDDTSDSEAELFARNRYGSKQFEIILAIELMEKEKKECQLYYKQECQRHT